MDGLVPPEKGGIHPVDGPKPRGKRPVPFDDPSTRSDIYPRAALTCHIRSYHLENTSPRSLTPSQAR